MLLPARMSRAEEARWVDVMLERLEKQERRSAGRAARGDVDLGQRAAELSRQFLGGVPKPASVRWVSNQGSRWGSCTPVDGTIRLSDRMVTMPSWVVDYVLVHELAHLIEFAHSPRFYELVDAYPKAERARGYLLGVVAAADWLPERECDEDTAVDADAACTAAAPPAPAHATPARATPAHAAPAHAAHATPAPAPGGLW